MEKAIIYSDTEITERIQAAITTGNKPIIDLLNILSLKLEKINPVKSELTEDTLFSKKSLIEYFDGKLSIGKINYLMKNGDLKSIKLGRNVFYKKSSIDALLRRFND